MKILKPCVYCIVTLGLSVSLVATANAKPKKKRGFEMAAQTGYSLPLGEVTDEQNEDMDTVSRGQVPLLIDLGYRASPLVFVGAYLGPSWGRLDKPTAVRCDAADDTCYQWGFRAGMVALFHLQPRGDADPWLGVTAGYERLTNSLRGDTRLDTSFSGWEIGARGGVDFELSKVAHIGPFLSVTTAQYGSKSVACEGNCAGIDEGSDDIEERGIHTWLTLGFRGTLTIW